MNEGFEAAPEMHIFFMRADNTDKRGEESASSVHAFCLWHSEVSVCR